MNMIVNTNKSRAREMLDKAVARFRRAYKVPTMPRIRQVSPSLILYDWMAIKAKFKLELIGEKASFCVWNINSSLTPIKVPFTYIFDDELVNVIIECLEYWVNSCMEG